MWAFPDPRTPTGALRWLLAVTLVFYAIQALYSRDVSNAIENIGFFFVPFAALFVLLAEVEWTKALLTRAVQVVGGIAVVLALIGLFQSATRDLFLNPELFDANQLHAYFRVNSLFFDPNILGRYMALAITVLAACLAWGSVPPLGLAASCRCGDLSGRARLHVLDHLHGGGDRRARDRRDPALELAWADRRRRARARRPRGARDRRRHTLQRHPIRPRIRLRAHVPGRGRHGPVRGPPDRRARVRRLRARLLRGHRTGADDGLSFRADHGRRRAGGDRADPLHRAAGRRTRDGARGGYGPFARAHRGRGLLRRDGGPQPRLRRFPQRPSDVGAAGARCSAVPNKQQRSARLLGRLRGRPGQLAGRP